MTKEGERKLAEAVASVIEHVSDATTSPTQALTKVAIAKKLGREEVRRVGEAYNTAAQLTHHMKTAGDARCDSFPLADSELALCGVFPADPQSVDRFQYEQILKSASVNLTGDLWGARALPTLQKAASVTEATTVSPLETLRAEERELTKQAAAIETQVERLEREIPWLMEKAADEVRERLHSMPFSAFECALCAKFGKEASDVADVIWEAGNFDSLSWEKRATDWSKYTLADFDRGGYGTVESLVAQSMELQAAHDKRASTKQAKAAKTEKRAALELNSRTILDILEEGLAKKGSIFSPLVGQLDNAAGAVRDGLAETPSLFGPDIKPAGEEQTKLMGSLMDPKSRNKLMQIKTQAALHDLMTNDEVIGQYDPAEVVKHYNLVQEHAPAVVDHKGALIDIMRRSLAQGGLTAQEYGQLAEVVPTAAQTYSGNLANDLTLGGGKKKPPQEDQPPR